MGLISDKEITREDEEAYNFSSLEGEMTEEEERDETSEGSQG